MASPGWRVVRAAGARAPFPPCGPDPTAAAEAADQLRHLVRRTPRACGIDQTRWTLEAIAQACHWLTDCVPSTVQRMLKRFGIVVKRQPRLANDYEKLGREQPRAQCSHRADTLTRVVAARNAQTAAVTLGRASKITLATLVQCSQDLRAAYGDAERIYVVMDNWPVHSHPDVLVALEVQECQFAWHRPANWPTEPSAAAVKRWGKLSLPIQLVPLPTYAS